MSSDTLTTEERLELSMWHARVEAAELRLEAARGGLNACMKRVGDAHQIRERVDRVNLETGVIVRGPIDKP